MTYPIEKAVSAVSDVKFVESKSRQGLSTVRLWMNWGADVNNGQTEVIQRIQQILNSLPTGIKQPFIVRFDLSNIPVALVTVAGGGLDERQLYDLAYNTIEPQLERLGGVASASVDGGKVRQITVNLNRDQLYAKRLSVLDVVRAVNESNFLLPAGDIKVGRPVYDVLLESAGVRDAARADVFPPVQRQRQGRGQPPVEGHEAGDVAGHDVVGVDDEEVVAVVRIDGSRGVFMRVNKQPGANTIAVVDQVRELLPKVTGVPPGVNVGITFDQSVYIRQAIESLWHEAIQGSALAFIVILVFLRSLTSTLIISIAIPLSILLSFICMYFLGQTLNVIQEASHFGTPEDVYDGLDLTESVRLLKGINVSGGVSIGRERLNNCYALNDLSLMSAFSGARLQNRCDVRPPFQPNVKFLMVYPVPWGGVQAGAAFQSIPGPQILASYTATNTQILPSLGRNLAAGINGTATPSVAIPMSSMASEARSSERSAPSTS